MTKKAKDKGGFYTPCTQNASNAVLSADGRRLSTKAKFIEVNDAARLPQMPSIASPSHSQQSTPTYTASPDEAEARPELVRGLDGVAVVTKTRGKRSLASDEPMSAWLPFCEEYLDELLRLEGRGQFGRAATCPMCTDGVPEYRCQECLTGRLLCKACLLKTHALLPLHRIQQWAGTFFKPVKLRDLGYILCPSHPFGEPCVTASNVPLELVVLHLNGVHLVNVCFCKCRNLQRRTQLLRLGWWPATPFEPRTCATMSLLRHFHLLNLQGKVPAYDFYRTLELRTDNSGLSSVPDRSESFMLMVRQWGHITAVKRAGGGHGLVRIADLPYGSLAVPCRACPQPGVNLPDGWEQAKPEDAWLYQGMIAQDANFRLKNRIRHSKHKDPWLAPGLAYFVDEKPYADFLAEHATTQDDVRTCSGFAALLNALTRNSKGLRSTGVVAVSCRHELFRPNGLGDLQKGERYRNVDYVVAASIRGWDIRMIKDSFDIACEWRKGFFARIQDLPEEMRPAVPEDEWVFIVPKFHIAAHKESCQANYSSNFTPFCARWDGEHVERLWAYLNGIASSIKEMTAAGRWETIDDFCSFSNWRKTVQLGDDLLRLLIEAIPAAYDHKADFEAFDRRLRQERPHDVAEWEAMLSRWEADHRSPNPYVLPKTTTTRADVQLRYFMAENQAIADGKRASHDGGPCSFIVLGMEIRQARSSLAAQKKTATTVLQQVDLHKRAAPLLHRLNQFLDLQAVYMPRLASHTSPQPPPTVDTIYSYPLHLPSELAPDIRALVCVEGLAQIEDDLQYAEACEALDELRHALRIRTSYNRAKIKNVTGQVLNTRAREKQATVDEAVNAAKQRYRAARLALMQLRGAGDWEATL
ncbi:hypothetical protein OH77DRAFT_1465897 [Trametes cingulata]|nr:hypothetical protein OH77DRAFT_1465897 [Trametes cingulata]